MTTSERTGDSGIMANVMTLHLHEKAAPRAQTAEKILENNSA